MKKTIFLAAVATLFTFASCQKEIAPVIDENGDLIFTGTIAESDSRTSINTTSGAVTWVSGDEITITDAASTSVKYVVSDINDGTATFTKKDGESGTLGTGPYTAVYGSAPSTAQTYSSTVPSLPMSAESSTTALAFAVSCGLLELNFTYDGQVDTIKVAGTPTGGTATSYKLICNSSVDVTSSGKFYIALPAGSYSFIGIAFSGHKICTKEKSGANSISIAANTILPVSLSLTDSDTHFAVQLWENGPYWATTNIGAESPNDYGQYFAWGYCDGQTSPFTKYFDSSNYPNVVLNSLDALHDMATVNWGAGWTVPSYDDWSSFILKASRSYVRTGVYGESATGKDDYSSNSIFLPVTGKGTDGSNNYLLFGFYWSKTQCNDNEAYYFKSDPDDDHRSLLSHFNKYNGLSVRPVRSSL